jgi:two-component system LytT family response regulator
MPEVRVAIIDDEPLVRTGLRSLLEREPDIAIVGEARNGSEAVALITDARPDLVFLDVRMPVLDGFSVLARLEPERMPALVFVTAFDEYAVRAFDAHAVDYLLKPFDEERFQRALERARARLRERTPADRSALEAVLSQLLGRQRYAERLLIRSDGRMIVIAIDDIDWIESADNYVRVHQRNASYLLREPIKSIEQRLDPRRFARAHRSAIINLARVSELEPLAGGDYRILLSTGAQIILSRTYRDSFRNQLASGAWPAG